MPRMKDIFEQMEQEAAANAQAEPWEKIKSRIKQGEVLPIISNSFRIEQIFRQDDLPAEEGSLSLYEVLTQGWARMIKYPMQDNHDLARVAQYYLVETVKDRQNESRARKQYIEFLKKTLINIAKTEPRYKTNALYQKKVDGLLAEVRNKRFSEITTQLDYPRILDQTTDPLYQLAKLDLPIYITTSQSDFLERALESVGKKEYKTQICFWSGEIVAKPEHRTDPNFAPTKDAPLVYHLFGLEDYPETLVLSEEDYVNFLISVIENKNTQNPLIPTPVRLALGRSPLVLLGYRLQDWDFRVLFRFIQSYERADRSMVVQLKPDVKEHPEVLEKYLQDYFDIRKFDIDWNKVEDFVQKICAD